MTRSYSARTLKILWGRSAGRCALSDCRVELIIDDNEDDQVLALLGENAHITASSVGGPRGNDEREESVIDDYSNLILLCRNCHRRIDQQPEFFTINKLSFIKNQHEDWIRYQLPEIGVSLAPWQPLILQGEIPIASDSIGNALPGESINASLRIKLKDQELGSPSLLPEMKSILTPVLAGQDLFQERFAIFPLAPISICVTLGYVLTNRCRARFFQYHRDEQAWGWPNGQYDAGQIKTKWDVIDPVKNIRFVISLSAQINLQDVNASGVPIGPMAAISIDKPSLTWLVNESQLVELRIAIRKAFEKAASDFPEAENWHIFYAGPAPGAVVLGQEINPTMSPPVHVYEFRRNQNPRYFNGVILKG